MRKNFEVVNKSSGGGGNEGIEGGINGKSNILGGGMIKREE